MQCQWYSKPRGESGILRGSNPSEAAT